MDTSFHHGLNRPLLGAIALFVMFLVGCSDSGLVRLNEVSSFPSIERVYFADLDGDGGLEVVSYARGHSFIPRYIVERIEGDRADPVGSALYQINYPDSLTVCEVRPVDIDGRPGSELTVSVRDYANNAAWIEVLNGSSGSNLSTTEPIVGVDRRPTSASGHKGWDAQFRILDAVDIDGDGSRELIAMLDVGHDCYPRGIYTYDYPSGQLKWSFPTPGNPADVHIVDIDGDTQHEFVFLSGLHGNMCEVDGRFDTSSHLFAVDSQGRLLWTINLGGRLDMGTGAIAVFDTDHDGTYEVYCSKLAEHDDHNTSIRLLQRRRAGDGHLLAQAVRKTDFAISNMELVDVDQDGIEELITDGDPNVWDPQTLDSVTGFSGGRSRVRHVGNVDGDANHTQELVCTSGDTLRLLSQKSLTEIAFCIPRPHRIIDDAEHFHDALGQNYLALLTRMPEKPLHELVILRVDVISGVQEALAIVRSLTGKPFTVGLVFIIGVAMGSIMVGIRKRSREKTQARPASLEKYGSVLTTLTTFGHGQMAGKNLDRVAFLSRNLPDSSDRLKGILPNLMAAAEAYRSLTKSQSMQLISQCRRHKVLRRHANSLQRALERVDAGIGAFDSADELDDVARARLRAELPAAVQAVKDELAGIWRDLYILYGSDLTGILSEVLSGCKSQIIQDGIHCEDTTIKGDLTRRVFFSQPTLSAILEELISNARFAMKHSPTKAIKIEAVFTQEEAVLKILDSGPGLGDTDPQQPFERSYTTKKGQGGFGLYHAKTEVEKFNGRISIANRQDRSGAIVEMRLKLVPDEAN